MEKPSTGAVFKQQLNEMEKSWRKGETARNNALHTLPRTTPASSTSTTPTKPTAASSTVGRGENGGVISKPPNLNISETSAITNAFNDTNGVCESPSYLTSGSMYSFGNDVAGNLGAGNPVPLPPRDRFKPTTLPNQKRHVRKHALIIPATGTLRTLDKLGANHLSEENRMRLKTVSDKSKMDMHSETNYNLNSEKINFSALSKLQVVESAPQSPALNAIYQNFSMIPEVHADSASLDFETIVEKNDLNNVPDMFSFSECSRSAAVLAGGGGGCDRVDGMMPSNCSREVDAVTKAGGVSGENKNAVEGGETSTLSNSVSCEDLLEFSEKTPNGPQRGTESDEVRIMIKVLGPKASGGINN